MKTAGRKPFGVRIPGPPLDSKTLEDLLDGVEPDADSTTRLILALAPTVRIRGALDLIYDTGDGWRVVDYKTVLFRGKEADIQAAVQQRVAQYRVQSAIYTLAAQAALPDERICHFTFFFTAVGETATLTVDEDWPRGKTGRLLEIVEQIRARGYGDAPLWEKETCDGCDYLLICRPDGIPQREVARALQCEPPLSMEPAHEEPELLRTAVETLVSRTATSLNQLLDRLGWTSETFRNLTGIVLDDGEERLVPFSRAHLSVV